MNIKYLFYSCVLLVWNTFLFSQGVQFTASLDRAQVTKDQHLIYQLKIQDGSNISQFPDVVMPDFKGKFDIVGSSQQTSFSIINGKVASSLMKSFTLLPVSEGRHTIDPAEIKYQNQIYRTDPMEVHVLPTQAVPVQTNSQTQAPTPPPTQLSNIFLKQTLSKTEVYSGEQVLYRLSLYRRIRLLGDIAFELPSFEKFWVEPLEGQTNENIKNIGNTRFYERHIQQKALFPLGPGELLIGPAKAGVLVNFFEGQRILNSEPLKLVVKPLPAEGKPIDFKGAVGEFSLSAELINQKTFSQFSPLSLKVTLSGSGNLRNINTLLSQDDPAFKIYPPEITDDFQLSSNLSGTRTFEYVVVPKQAGEVTLPSFSFVYFSPEKEAYVTLTTQPIVVTLETSDVAPETFVTQSSQAKELTSLTEEIRYLKTTDLDRHIKPKVSIFWIVLLSLNIFYWLWLGYKKLHVSFFAVSQKDQAKKNAFNLAKRELQNLDREHDKLCSQLQTVVLGYLTSKTSLNMTGFAKNQIQSQLESMSISSDTIQELLTLLDALSFAAYTPSTSIDALKYCKETESCIEKLEKEFS